MNIEYWLILSVVAIPVAFIIGRYSTKVAFFHAKTEEKLTVPEFIRSRHS
jgi:hypothetical protein